MAELNPWTLHQGAPHTFANQAEVFSVLIAEMTALLTHWTVVASSSGTDLQYILLKPNVGAGRVVIWSRQVTTPTTTAVPWYTRATNHFYCTYSHTSTEDVIAGDGVSAALLAAADAATCRIGSNPSVTANSVYYFAENKDTLYLHHSTNTVAYEVALIVGLCVVDEEGTALPGLGGSGASSASSNLYGLTSGSEGVTTSSGGGIGRVYLADPINGLSSNGSMLAFFSSAWRSIGKMSAWHKFTLENAAISKKYFPPYLLSNSLLPIAGIYRLRQIAYGPNADSLGTALEAGTGNTLAQALAALPPSTADQIWFTEFQP